MFPTQIRPASKYGLLYSGRETWSEFRKSRNLTSQVYNEDVARQVVERIPAFAVEVELLYVESEKRGAKVMNEVEIPAMPPIVPKPREWEELVAILRTLLPGRRGWAYGSRVTSRRAKRFFDLDLAVEGLTWPEAAALEKRLTNHGCR